MNTVNHLLSKPVKSGKDLFLNKSLHIRDIFSLLASFHPRKGQSQQYHIIISVRLTLNINKILPDNQILMLSHVVLHFMYCAEMNEAADVVH